jgi:HPt (histidine-containing phosphotransfer) domain-containing protein
MRGIVSKEMFDCIPEIEFEAGQKYFLGNMDNYTMALMSMLKSIKSKLPILHSMRLSDEYEGLRTITQTLRKMLSNIGALGMAQITYQLEFAVLNDDYHYLQEQLPEYIMSLFNFSNHLETLLKNLDSRNSAGVEEIQSSYLNYDFTKTKESIKRSADLLERKII